MYNIAISHSQQEDNKCALCTSEFSHTQLIYNELCKMLKQDGLVNVYEIGNAPHELSDPDALKEEIKKINALKLDKNVSFLIDIHTNADNGTATGCECWSYPGNESTLFMSKCIVEGLTKLGLVNRGCKSNAKFLMLNSTTIGSIIVECWFHDNLKEATWGHSNILQVAKAIKDGIYKALGLKLETDYKNKYQDLITALKNLIQKSET